MTSMRQRYAAEALGTGVLSCAVVGSGIMAAALTPDTGLQLLINAVAVVMALGVLIALLGQLSGAHFNPAVTLVAAVRRQLPPGTVAGYCVAQVIGAVAGVTLANLMFTLPAWSASEQNRGGGGIWLGEVVATAGLILVIGGMAATGNERPTALLVPAWIGAAYFFTSSTSFANPAVTIGRAFSDTFAGISPGSVPAFVAFELLGAALGAGLVIALYRPTHRPPEQTSQSPEPEGVTA